jgi:hypothetical protein
MSEARSLHHRIRKVLSTGKMDEETLYAIVYAFAADCPLPGTIEEKMDDLLGLLDAGLAVIVFDKERDRLCIRITEKGTAHMQRRSSITQH